MEPHGLKFSKVHFPSHFSGSICACSLVVVAILVIEVPSLIVDRGMKSVSDLSREVLPETPNRAHTTQIKTKGGQSLVG
jgi:hypothetical protein